MGDEQSSARTRTCLPGDGLLRERLLQALDSMDTTRLGLVVAPAGFGKTTVMRQWVAHRSEPVLWRRIEPSDAEPGRLAIHLAGALQLDGGEPPLIVLDDAHLLAGTGALADLERFILACPPRLRVLIGSRVLPGFNLASTEMPAPVMLTRDDLRFRAWEVERLFRQVYRLPLRPDDAAALTRRTQGWAAALRLFQLSTAGGGAGQLRTLAQSGHPRSAREYLTDQVLRGLPAWLRHFLRQTCVFEVLTADRCDALLGQTCSLRALLELERRQVLAAADDGLTFSCHPVLRANLLTSLGEELGMAGCRRWHAEAAAVLEQQDAPAEAVRARCHAQDWAAVRLLLASHGDELSRPSRSGWLDLLPEPLVATEPWAALATARRLLADGRLEAAAALAAATAPRLADPSGERRCANVIHAAQSWSPEGGDEASTWPQVLLAAVRAGPAAAAARARGLSAAHALTVEGLAALVCGDIGRADRLVRQATQDLPESDPGALVARLAVAAVTALTTSISAPGEGRSAGELDRVHLEAEAHGLTWVARLARGVAVARGGEPGNVAVTRQMASDRRGRGDDWGAVLLEAAAAIAGLRAGRPDADALEDLAGRFRTLTAGALEAWARSAHALVAASLDLPEAADEAASATAFARMAAVPGALAVSYAALAASRPDRADELMEAALATAQTAGLGFHPWLWLTAAKQPAPAKPVTQASARRSPGTYVRATPPRLSLTCFGFFTLGIDGHGSDLLAVRPSARTLLRFLALHTGRPVHREQIADALWGDLERAPAMHNLQVAVSTLRRHLEPGVPGRASAVLVRHGETYSLAPGQDGACDLLRFDAALARAARNQTQGRTDETARDLRAALELYAGDVLEADGPAEWVSKVRDHYRFKAADAASTLADLELRRGRPAAAVAAAARSIQIERWCDASWRTLIEAYRRAGDLAESERARREYAAMLDALGVGAEGPVPARADRAS